jgi:hypothetical protein
MPGKTMLAAGAMAALSVSLLLAQEKLAIPTVLHLCVAGCSTGKGSTLVLENGRYADRLAAGSTYTIEKFTPQLVVLHRTDEGQYAGTAILTGQLSKDGNSVVNGILQWTSHPCCGLTSGPFRAAWGDAIDTVPGNPAERAARSIVPCNAQSRATADEALQRGMEAMTAKRQDVGICWLRLSAKQGNATAQGSLAVFFFRGIGVPVDLPEALAMAKGASAQNNFLGDQCLALMYESGQGVPQDAAAAAQWRSKAQQDQQAEMRRRQTSQQAGNRTPDIWTLMNTKTAWGATPLELMRGVMGGDPDLGDYTPVR